MRPLFVERRRDAKLRIAAKIRCRTVFADVGVAEALKVVWCPRRH
jgi:hypothetical protein